ncbi:MAG: hypothetical protein WKG07_30105 [Hymenobacter sp.]
MQIDAGLNIALAGLRRHARRLTPATGRQHSYTLRSPGEQAERVRALPPQPEAAGRRDHYSL